MRKEKGFTLIELLIVRNYRGHRDPEPAERDRPRQAEEDHGRHAVDNNFYPRNYSTFSAALQGNLSPIYIKTAPSNDGWNTVWQFASDATGSKYTITSYTKDAVVSALTGGQTGDFNCDIIFANGQFFQWPQGTQT